MSSPAKTIPEEVLHARCAEEPIHTPGRLQPFAVVLSGLLGQTTVLHCSANTGTLLDLPPASVLGRPLPELLPSLPENIFDTDNQFLARTLPLHPEARPLTATCHTWAGHWFVQLEPLHTPGWDVTQLPVGTDELLRLSRHTHLDNLLGDATGLFRSLLGYDRVMVYRFHPDWHGEVVAESLHGRRTRFKGLHYPATDIPSQARELYLHERLRLIPDVHAESVPLIALGTLDHLAPPLLDLTGSTARAISPIHCEYLRNMGVRATCVLSLVVDGRLWGLLACHHDQPRLVPPLLRASALALAEMLSVQIANLATRESTLRQANFRQQIIGLGLRLDGNRTASEIFEDSADSLLSSVRAEGALFIDSTRILTSGHVPPLPAAFALLDWLRLHAAREGSFASEETPPPLHQHPAWPAHLAGLLAARLGADPEAPWLIFFRDEWPREVRWGGHPGHTVSLRPDGTLAPRSSFEAWVELQRGRSRPWTNSEVDYSHQLALTLSNGQLIQERLRAETDLRRSESKRAAMLSALPDLVFILADDGTYLEAHIPENTPAFLPREKCLGRRVHDVLPREVASLFFSALDALRKGAPHQIINYALELPGQDRRHYEGRLAPFAPGQVLLVAHDITERHQAQEAISRLALVARHTASAVIFTGLDRLILWVNDAFTRITGYQESEAIGRSPGFLQGPDTDPAVVAAIRQALTDGRRFRGEIINYSRDSRPYWIDLEIIPHRDPSGTLLGFIGVQSDINDRKHHETLLRESLAEAEKANLLLEAASRIAHLGYWEIFRDGRPSIWSDLTCEIHDLAPDQTVDLAQALAFYAPAKRDELASLVERCLALGEPYEIEAELVTASGRRIWTSSRGVPVRDSTGAITGARGVIQDITDRKHSDLALRERDERFAAITRHVPGVIYQYRTYPDGTYRFTYASDGAEEIWGVPRAELLAPGFPLLDRIHPDDQESMLDQCRLAAESLRSFRNTLRYHHPVRGLRWLSTHDTPTPEPDGTLLWHGYASDVTDLTLAQKAISDEQVRLRILIESIPAAIFLKDGEGRWLFVNRLGLETMGVAQHEWQNKTDAQLAGELPALSRFFHACLASDELAWLARRPTQSEEVIGLDSDQELTLDVNKVPLFNSDGSRRSLIIVATDITERKQAADLVDRERRLFTAGPVVVIIWRPLPGMPVEYVSANIEAILGYPPAHFTAPDFSYARLIHPDDFDRIRAETDERRLRRVPYFEQSYRLRAADGTYRWIYDCTRVEYTPEGGITSIRGYLFDQTQLKTAQDELRQRNEQITSIAVHVPGMLYEFRRFPAGGGCFPYASEGIHDLLALTPDEVRLNDAPFFARIHPEDRDKLACSIDDSYRSVEDWSSDFRILHPERGLRWIHGSSSPRKLEDGSYVWDGYCFDITDRKNAEESLLREGKREAIERLAGGVAHDFNNYLASLALSADLLLNLPDLDPRVLAIASTLNSEIDSATAVARQLLAFTKDQPVHREPILLDVFLRDCAAFALRGSPMRALVDVPDRSLRLVTDPDLLRQVVFNLILNSRQAMKNRGTVLLSAELTSPHVVTLRVGDTGPGIPETHRAKIFEPYFTTKSAGSGLGLFVVRSVLRRLGGDIRLDPTTTEGATFLITLPPAGLPPPSSPAPEPAPTRPLVRAEGFGAPPSAETRVLLLEDEPGQTRLLTTFFDTLRVHSECYADGEVLLAEAPAFRDRGASVVCLLDITVRGGLGGLDIAPALRELLPAARIFLVSGYSAEWQQKEKSLAGLDIGFIAKPYHLRDLKTRLFGA